MNRSALNKIHSRYDADHDIGPTAPIPWSVEELAIFCGKLADKVERLEEQVEQDRILRNITPEAQQEYFAEVTK